MTLDTVPAWIRPTVTTAGSMVTFAGDLDPEEITGRRDGAGPRHDRAERQVLAQVQAEGGIHVGVLQHTLLDHL